MEEIDGRRIDFGEGAEAIERLNRTAIMLIDGAIGVLISLGYDRQRDSISIGFPEGEGKWMDISMGKRVVYSVDFSARDSSIFIVGNWVDCPKRRGWLARIWCRIF